MERLTKRIGFLAAGLGLLACVCLLLAGCAGGASYHNGRLETRHTIYEAQPPDASWRVIAVDNTDLAFWNEKLSASILVNSTCEGYRDVPVRSLANHLFIGIEDKVFLEQRHLPLDGRLAWYSLVEGLLDGARVKVAAYTMVKDYCTYDLSYTAPLRNFDAGFEAFSRVARDFRVIKRKQG